MTPLSEKILAEYQVRKTWKQKTRFIEMLQSEIADMTVEEGGFPRSRNLVVGDVESAKIVFTAHYDTCARLPFPNMIFPKNMLFSLLYGVLVAIPFFFVGIGAGLLMRLTPLDPYLEHWLAMIVTMAALFGVMLFGPANRHTANDNTSGVVMLCELIAQRPEGAAFVFFDNEEYGLFGSALFRKMHKKSMKSKLLVNFDCVGDGDNILIVANRKARKAHPGAFEQSYASAEGKRVLIEKSAFYPSDQQGFAVNAAVAALHRAPVAGLYMNRIHTDRDRILDERNIELLREGSLKLVRAVTSDEEGER